MIGLTFDNVRELHGNHIQGQGDNCPACATIQDALERLASERDQAREASEGFAADRDFQRGQAERLTAELAATKERLQGSREHVEEEHRKVVSASVDIRRLLDERDRLRADLAETKLGATDAETIDTILFHTIGRSFADDLPQGVNRLAVLLQQARTIVAAARHVEQAWVGTGTPTNPAPGAVNRIVTPLRDLIRAVRDASASAAPDQLVRPRYPHGESMGASPEQTEPDPTCNYCVAFTVGSPATEHLVCECVKPCGADRCNATTGRTMCGGCGILPLGHDGECSQ